MEEKLRVTENLLEHKVGYGFTEIYMNYSVRLTRKAKILHLCQNLMKCRTLKSRN